MRQLFHVLLILVVPQLLIAQKQLWLTLEKEQFEDFMLSLEIIHHPSLADKEWLRVSLENKTNKPFSIQKAKYVVDCVVFDQNDKRIKAGTFSSNNPSEFLDNAKYQIIPENFVHPGINHITKYPSAYASSILGVPKDKSYKVQATITLQLDLYAKGPVSIQWENIQFEFEWFRPSDSMLNTIQQELIELLQHPSIDPYHHHQLSCLLDVEDITEKVRIQDLLTAKNVRFDFQDGKEAILRHLNDKFAQDQLILDHFLTEIKQHNLIALEDLAIATTIWESDFLEPLLTWYENGNLSTRTKIVNVLHPRYEKWKGNPHVTRQLSDILLNDYSDILYAVPDSLSTEDLIFWGSLASLLGKTCDLEAIGILCPFLKNKTEIFNRSIYIDANSLHPPRPIRVCDIAVEAILNLQQANIDQSYRKKGFDPPYVYGEAEIIITRIRDEMALEFSCTDFCTFSD